MSDHPQMPRQLLRQMFDAAVASAQPSVCVPPHLPDPDEVKGRLIVIGAGKAAAAMARAVEQHWPRPVSGLVVTRHGHAVPCRYVEVVEATHPVPDAAGEAAAARMIALVQGLGAEDLVLCLISGGGSALLPLPLEGLTLQDKQAISRDLLASGASISQMNTVRRHLSCIKGGRLAAACHPARVLTLLISDVPRDRLIDIASGPTVADPTTCQDALDIVQRFGIDLPTTARELLESGRGESVKPADTRLARAQTRVIAAPQMALEAAAVVARRAGYAPCVLGDAIEGEAREIGKVLAAIALQVAERGQPIRPPCVLLSGGEATVTLCTGSAYRPSSGRGGRNVECLLSMGIALEGHPRIHALAADTDGVDGNEDIAGATLGPHTLQHACSLGLNPHERLDANDGHGFFSAVDESVITGPTLTNVNDFRAILIEADDGVAPTEGMQSAQNP